MQDDNITTDTARKAWEPPTITPLPRLGERTTPTTISASSPKMHTSDLSDIRDILDSLPPEPPA
jgi:hypothetical protein